MAFLVETPDGLSEALEMAKRDEAIWCFSSALTEDEYAAIERDGVTRFNWSPGAGNSPQSVESAVATVREHHPGERIWVEHAERA